MLASRYVVASSLLLLAACSGSSASVGDPTGAPPSDGSGAGTGTGTGTDPDPGGPRLTLRITGSTDPVAHTDGYSGETAKVQIAAIKSLWLLRSDDDPSPVKVFDLGDNPALVDYVSNQPVTLATVARKSIPSGTYRKAKVGVSYVRYSVGARMHANGVSVDGQYDNVQALSDGAVIDGQARSRGWYRYAFSYQGTTYGALEGGGAPTPAVPQSGGVTLDTSGPEAFYVFGFDSAYDASVTYDETVTFEANVHQSFRWQDQAVAEYAPGIFDTTPTSYEPVMSFGANAYRVTFERSSSK